MSAQFCQLLGWKGKGTQFDFLPMLISGSDGQPRYYDLPDRLCMEVKIRHPTIEAITNLGLKWFGLPGVSSMMFECGGLQFPGAPFAGWYQGTEVASRDFLDPQRYDLLNTIGEAMGLDMSTNTSLWKDEVALELNKAVLSSYKEAGVSIVDHHTMADQFVSHLQEETKVRGGCPADWVWIVPPQAGSLVSTFHQEMINYHLSPSYEYQDKPYETWFRSEKRKTFKSVALTILMWSSLYVKMVNKRKVFKIFYSSETGTAKKYAREALDLLSISFRTEMCALNEVEATFDTLGESDVAIVIVSTFGNGEPPEMSRGYMKRMNSVMEMFQAGDPKVRKMYQDIGIEKKHFAVFGLGSTAYPKFAAFGKTLDNIYETVGATRMLPLSTGDELKDQRGSFNKWLRKLFLVSLKVMEVEAPKSYLEKMTAVKQHKWRLSVKDRKRDVNDALSDLSGFPVHDFTITKRSQLHPEKDEPATIKVDFEFSSDDVSYDPGDHLTIYPMNDKEKVEFLKSRLNNNPPDNRLVSLLVDNGGLWEQVDDFPTEVYFSDLLCYFIDVNQVPSQALLGLLARYTEDKQEKESLTVLANDDEIYDKWREDAKVRHKTSKIGFLHVIFSGHLLDSAGVCLRQHQLRPAGEPAQPHQAEEVQHRLGPARSDSQPRGGSCEVPDAHWQTQGGTGLRYAGDGPGGVEHPGLHQVRQGDALHTPRGPRLAHHHDSGRVWDCSIPRLLDEEMGAAAGGSYGGQDSTLLWLQEEIHESVKKRNRQRFYC